MKKFLAWAFVIATGYLLVTGHDFDRVRSYESHGSPTTQSEEPRVEVRYKYKERVVPGELSDDCKAELKWSKKATATARELARTLNPQQGIIDDAYKAIVSKDWAALNDAKQRQINLDNKADKLRMRLAEEEAKLDRVEGSCSRDGSRR